MSITWYFRDTFNSIRVLFEILWITIINWNWVNFPSFEILGCPKSWETRYALQDISFENLSRINPIESDPFTQNVQLLTYLYNYKYLQIIMSEYSIIQIIHPKILRYITDIYFPIPNIGKFPGSIISIQIFTNDRYKFFNKNLANPIVYRIWLDIYSKFFSPFLSTSPPISKIYILSTRSEKEEKYFFFLQIINFRDKFRRGTKRII